MSYSELPDKVKSSIMRYIIDCNEAYGYTDEQYREIYTRLNKYAMPLNNQELRKAEFPGNFYDLAEKIANLEILDNWKVFTVASRRRLLDVEFISEILAGLLEGPQDKKKSLDDFYIKYSKENLDNLEKRMVKALDDINILFPEDSISKTRFKQKSDFYSLFLSIDYFTSQDFSFSNKNVSFLQQDFKFLDENIRPSEEDYTSILTDYAIRCLSSANSISSRKWRINFLKIILAGTYLNNTEYMQLLDTYKSDEKLKNFLELYDMVDPAYFDSGMCPLGDSICPICDEEIFLDDEEWILLWERHLPLQISNLHVSHKKHCGSSDYIEYHPTYRSLISNIRFGQNKKADFIEDLFGDIDD